MKRPPEQDGAAAGHSRVSPEELAMYELTAGSPVTTVVSDVRRGGRRGAVSDDDADPGTPRSLLKVYRAEWEAITGLVAVAVILLSHLLNKLHVLHEAVEPHMLPLTLFLLALLFIRVLRREPEARRTLKVARSGVRVARDIRGKLAEVQAGGSAVRSLAQENHDLLLELKEDMPTRQQLRMHDLSLRLHRIEESATNSLIKKSWEQMRHDIEELANGRIVVRAREDIFDFKQKGLEELAAGEHFLSTVTPADLVEPTYTHEYFAKYKQGMFRLARRTGPEQVFVRRLYIFKHREQMDDRGHRQHMEEMARHGVEVRYLLLEENFGNQRDRDKVEHEDYAIFGHRFYAQFDMTNDYSVIETDQPRIDDAVSRFEMLWKRAAGQTIPPAAGGES